MYIFYSFYRSVPLLNDYSERNRRETGLNRSRGKKRWGLRWSTCPCVTLEWRKHSSWVVNLWGFCCMYGEPTRSARGLSEETNALDSEKGEPDALSAIQHWRVISIAQSASLRNWDSPINHYIFQLCALLHDLKCKSTRLIIGMLGWLGELEDTWKKQKTKQNATANPTQSAAWSGSPLRI